MSCIVSTAPFRSLRVPLVPSPRAAIDEEIRTGSPKSRSRATSRSASVIPPPLVISKYGTGCVNCPPLLASKASVSRAPGKTCLPCLSTPSCLSAYPWDFTVSDDGEQGDARCQKRKLHCQGSAMLSELAMVSRKCSRDRQTISVVPAWCSRLAELRRKAARRLCRAREGTASMSLLPVMKRIREYDDRLRDFPRCSAITARCNRICYVILVHTLGDANFRGSCKLTYHCWEYRCSDYLPLDSSRCLLDDWELDERQQKPKPCMRAVLRKRPIQNRLITHEREKRNPNQMLLRCCM